MIRCDSLSEIPQLRRGELCVLDNKRRKQKVIHACRRAQVLDLFSFSLGLIAEIDVMTLNFIL
jgi:hypothetical protein